ncbi:hypothetical protein D1B32_13795 [Oceanobacillus profundus]|uniref:Uncharacterized protein n=1 Tax=Oceanobacillus profundus TaxID=372463 RepID=A0A417YF06_9BACI|nr:hypothetical protein D1B32_13795 [Oceanobacillus profundus]
MFKSEVVNRIISLVGFWIVVFFILFSDNIVGGPIIWITVIVITAFHLYGIIHSLKKNRNNSLK